MDEVGFLLELLEIYSPSGKEATLASYLAEKMAQLGFDVQIDEVGNVIGESAPPHPCPPAPLPLRTSAPLLLFLGHIDTVPGFIPARLEDGRLYGRGAVDAKGPLAAFIVAAARAAPSLTNIRIVVIGAVEEETSSRGALHIVDKFKPDYAIVGEPSGWNGIALGYKGSLLLSYRLSLPAKHNAADGLSAPEEAIGFWNRLVAYAEEINQGKARRFEMLDLSLQEINSSGDGFVQRTEMTISLRTPVGFEVETFKEKALGLANGAELNFRNEEAPFRADKNNQLVRAFLRAIRALGGKPLFKLKTGTSDMNLIGPAWGCPVVAYGPGDSSLDHTPNEYVEVEEYLKAINVLERVCHGIANQQAPKRRG